MWGDLGLRPSSSSEADRCHEPRVADFYGIVPGHATGLSGSEPDQYCEPEVVVDVWSEPAAGLLSCEPDRTI